MKYWLILAFILAILSLFATIAKPGNAFVGLRYNGMMTNPNAYGFVIFFSILPIIWAIFEKKQTNPLNYCLLGFFLITLLMSGSRSSLFSLTPLIIATVIFYIKKPGLILAIVLAGIIVLPIVVFTINPEVLGRFTSTQSSGRVEMWKFLWPYITSAPLGNGIGWIDQNMGYPPHNSYLWMATEAGLVWAFIFFVSMVLLALHGGLRRKYYETTEFFHFKILLVMTLLGFMFTAMFESWLVGVGGYHLLCFLFAIGLKEGFITDIQQRYANPFAANFDPLLDEEEIFTPVFLAKNEYYLKKYYSQFA